MITANEYGTRSGSHTPATPTRLTTSRRLKGEFDFRPLPTDFDRKCRNWK